MDYKLLGVMNVSTNLTVVMVSMVYTHVVKTHQIVQFKYVQFIACQLHLNEAVFKMKGQLEFATDN